MIYPRLFSGSRGASDAYEHKEQMAEVVLPWLPKGASNVLSAEVLMLFYFALFADVALYGITGDLNSRWLSFLDSLAHCCAWAVEDADLSHPIQVFGTVLSKYGSGLIVSILLGVTPGFLQTSTTVSFTIALAISQASTSLATLVRSRNGPWRTLFVFVGSLHRTRKLRFALSKCHNLNSAFVIGTIAMELTGWLAVYVRSEVRDQFAIKALFEYIIRNRLRFLIGLMTILVTYYNLWPLGTLLLVVLHKSGRPVGNGNSLHFELF